MELTQLHYFVTVAKTENITKAAQMLFISQPALSRVILRLEQELGTPLFDRKGGRITLNERGRTFLRYVEPALDSINAGVHEILGEQGHREILIHNYLSADLVRPIMERCQAKCTDMTFMLRSVGNTPDDDYMLGEKPDIVMLPTKDFHGYLFPMSFMEQWCVIYNCQYRFHSAFNGASITMEQLAKEPIVFTGSRYDREFVEKLFAEAGIKPQIISCAAFGESSIQISRCKGVALVPASNFKSLIMRIDSIPIGAALISDVPCKRLVYLGRSPGFLSNQDEYQVLESIKNYLSKEYAEIDAFIASYFGVEN